MKLYIFILSIACWGISVILHFLTFTNIEVGEFPFVWLLHLGIFLVWFPTINYLNKNEELKLMASKTISIQEFNNSKYYSIIFRNTPKWFKVLLIISAIYAFINFALFIYNQPIYGLLDSNLEFRGFSGHWFVFYGVAAGILWPKAENQ